MPDHKALFDQYAGQGIGYDWLSSPTENVDCNEGGKHCGFFYLGEQDTGCPDFQHSGWNCISSYLVELHSLGNIQAIHTANHSHAEVLEVCGPGGAEPCGFVFVGGHSNYGVMHNGYKTAVCQLPNDPPNYPYTTADGIDQPPYRTGHNHTNKLPVTINTQFWNSGGPNPLMFPYYPELPNRLTQFYWAAIDAWQYQDNEQCNNPEAAVSICPDGSCGYNHNQFQVFLIRLQWLPAERPFFGFVDPLGNIDNDCTETGPTCIPFYVSEDVPQGPAVMARDVRYGDPAFAPIQDYEDGTVLTMPGYTGE